MVFADLSRSTHSSSSGQRKRSSTSGRTRGHALFQQACAYGQSHEQAKPKERRLAQQQLEQELLALCQPYLASDCAQRVPCKRIEHFLLELFTLVADPRVPPDNNAAERSIHPLAVSRKISGGTRSEQGAQTRSVLATVFGAWIARRLCPFHTCWALLMPPQSEFLRQMSLQDQFCFPLSPRHLPQPSDL